jgi:hypothetical protein
MRNQDIERALLDAIADANESDAKHPPDPCGSDMSLMDEIRKQQRKADRLQHFLAVMAGALAYYKVDTSMVSEFQTAVIYGTNPLLDAPAADKPN